MNRGPHIQGRATVPHTGRSYRSVLCVAVAAVWLIAGGGHAKTRWGALQLIPDPDMLGAGEFVISGMGYYTADTSGESMVAPGGMARLGIVEWVNLHGGYAGGPTFGLKARILGETSRFMPTLTIGAHNIFSHKEAYYFGSEFEADTGKPFSGEYFIGLAKNLDAIKTRLHFGLQSIPPIKEERFNPYFGIEKYFGKGLYATVEVHRRAGEFHPSLFVAYRFFNNRFEINAGLVELRHLLLNDQNKFEFYLAKPAGSHFVKPGIWFGARFRGGFGLGKLKGFKSVDDRVRVQEEVIEELRNNAAELENELEKSRKDLSSVQQSLDMLVDSGTTGKEYLESVILEKLMALRSLYNTVPYDPEAVRNAQREIVAYRARALPALKDVVKDDSEDRFLRVLAISLIGEIGNRDASGVLLGILSESADPDLKIEALISLGKLKETRATYVMKQLANDPHDGVAFTAQEILREFEEELGVRVSPETSLRKVPMPESTSVVDKSIEARWGHANQDTAEVVATGDSTSHTSPEADTVGVVAPAAESSQPKSPSPVEETSGSDTTGAESGESSPASGDTTEDASEPQPEAGAQTPSQPAPAELPPQSQPAPAQENW